VIATLAAMAVAAAMAPGALRALPRRTNYRGVEVAFPMGVVAVVAALLVQGPAEAFGDLPDAKPMLLFVGVALLGLADDLLSGPDRGLRGHARALLRGDFSTGVLKAVGTASLVIMALHDEYSRAAEAIVAILIVVLTTNLFNLLDLRPGRAAKVFVLLAVGLLIAGGGGLIELIGPFAGPLLVIGVLDLRERCMLGDTGANLLGVLAGFWLIEVLDPTAQAVALGVLVALTIFGEFRSFSAAVERIPPLRALDSLGRKSHA
jgi:UDP-N-acetylmuramyl pentapeptide phosphotransferase/UDP-N-acetylglucosamine-1-phosphate transferase